MTQIAATEALIDAAASGNLAALRKAIRDGADINAKRDDAEGATALMWAAYKGHQAIVSALLEAGVDVNATAGSARSGQSPPPRESIGGGGSVAYE